MIKWIKQYNSNFLQVAVFLLFLFPLLSPPLPVISIILVGLLSLFFHKSTLKNFNLYLGISIAFPLLYLMHYFIDPSSSSWFVFEKKITLLFVPLIFSNFKVGAINKNLPLMAFILATTLLALYSLGYLIGRGVSPELLEGGISYAMRTTIESVVHIHPTYLSLFVSFSAAILASYSIKKELQFNTYLILVLLLLHIGFVLILASRIALVGLFATLIFMAVFHRRRLKKNLKYVVVGILLLIGGMWFIPSTKERVTEFISTVSSNSHQGTNSTNIRESIYYCSALILKENWLIGIGTSELQNHLNACYYIVGSFDIVPNNYNTHNEYLNIWLGLGLLGIIVFISILVGSFYLAKGNDIHLVFLLLFSLFCMTENLLERQHGVLFFTLWNSFFIISGKISNENKVG